MGKGVAKILLPHDKIVLKEKRCGLLWADALEKAVGFYVMGNKASKVLVLFLTYHQWQTLRDVKEFKILIWKEDRLSRKVASLA